MTQKEADGRKRLGLIVNPLAGIGGRVGLKGSDGIETVRRALAAGAEPLAPSRAAAALQEISEKVDQIELLTYPGEMGEDEARQRGFDPLVLGEIEPGRTTADDTREAARRMVAEGIDLLVFAGGDGTARDIHRAIEGQDIPVIGIPAGVKIHSSVYAVNPKRAGQLIREYLNGNTVIEEREVMDIDEEEFRQGRVSARLHGYLMVPVYEQLLQSAKSMSPNSSDKVGIAQYIADEMLKDWFYILGPGSTVKAVGDELGIDKTLLGVDIVCNKALIAKDTSEGDILAAIKGRQAKIVVTAIGGQGHVFGRGNQQISPEVIRTVGKKNIIVIAARDKLNSLDGPLLVDTGDADCDQYLKGYIGVVVAYNQEVFVEIAY